jgi:hypothetical protein
LYTDISPEVKRQISLSDQSFHCSNSFPISTSLINPTRDRRYGTRKVHSLKAKLVAFAEAGIFLQTSCDGLQQLAPVSNIFCNPMRHLLSFCRGMQQFTMFFNCLYKFATFASVSIKLEQFTGIIVYQFITGTSFTCVLPKVLKAEESTGLVSYLENLDPEIKINKRTSLKFATQTACDFHRKGLKNARETIIQYYKRFLPALFTSVADPVLE